MSSSRYYGYGNPTRSASSSGAGIGGVPRKMAKGIREIFKSGPLPMIFKKPYLRLFKFFFIVSAIVFIIIGLFLIDDSCGCVRMQDKLMMWMLKIHVIISILLLLIGIMFTEKYPRLSMLLLFITVTGILGVDSWIFYNYKRCIGKSEMQNSDKRFLTWIVTLMVIAGALWLGLLIIFGVIVNKYGKQQVTAQVQTDHIKISREYTTYVTEITKKIEDAKVEYLNKLKEIKAHLGERFVIPETDFEKIFEQVQPEKVTAKLRLDKTIKSSVIDDIDKINNKYKDRVKRKEEADKKFKAFETACENNSTSTNCTTAKNELSSYVNSRPTSTSNYAKALWGVNEP